MYVKVLKSPFKLACTRVELNILISEIIRKTNKAISKAFGANFCEGVINKLITDKNKVIKIHKPIIPDEQNKPARIVIKMDAKTSVSKFCKKKLFSLTNANLDCEYSKTEFNPFIIILCINFYSFCSFIDEITPLNL